MCIENKITSYNVMKDLECRIFSFSGYILHIEQFGITHSFIVLHIWQNRFSIFKIKLTYDLDLDDDSDLVPGSSLSLDVIQKEICRNMNR